MKQLEKDGQRGFSLIEIVLAVALLVVISSAAVPLLLRFYQQAAVEYETEHLLADIRKAQSMSRTSAPALGMDHSGSDDRQGASLLIDRESYLVRVGNGQTDIKTRHYYLPSVRVAKEGQTSADGFIFFKDNGGLRDSGSMMTLVVFCEGHMGEGRRIMISRAGGIRIDRRSL